MTKRSLTSLILKLLGVYILTQVVVVWPSAMHLFQNSFSWSWVAGIFLPCLLPLIILWLGPAILLLRYGDKIAAKLVPEDEIASASQSWSEDAVLRLVIIGLGLSMVISATPQVVGFVTTVIQSDNSMHPEWMERLQTSHINWGIRLGAEISLGLFLAVHPNGVIRLLKLLRRSGDAGPDSGPELPQ